MTLVEIQSILRSVDEALEAYQRNEGKLSAAEIRIKSLLGVVRKEIAHELCADTHARESDK